jgi:hypothetical protein
MSLRRDLGAWCALALAIAAIAGGAVPAASAKRAHVTGAHISLVARKSFCAYTGIADVYTGDGKVLFLFTLRNAGSSAGKVNIVPVRHYDDGGINESAMDMLIDVRVPAYSTKRYRSPLYKYKAHEHDVAACGMRINDGREQRIRAMHV